MTLGRMRRVGKCFLSLARVRNFNVLPRFLNSVVAGFKRVDNVQSGEKASVFVAFLAVAPWILADNEQGLACL